MTMKMIVLLEFVVFLRGYWSRLILGEKLVTATHYGFVLPVGEEAKMQSSWADLRKEPTRLRRTKYKPELSF